MDGRDNAKPLLFQEAAKLIAANESDVRWLAHGLCFWIWPQVRWPPGWRNIGRPDFSMFADLARYRRGRAEVVRALSKTLPSAATALVRILSDPVYSNFISDPGLGVDFHPVQIANLYSGLAEVRRRALEASKSPELVEDGRTKAGRNKALSPIQVDEKVACAATVMVAWKMAHGEKLGPQTSEAAEAAEILFALGSVEAGRYELAKRPKRWGDKLVSSWRRHFEEADRPSSALERQNATCAKDLENTRKWFNRDPSATLLTAGLAFVLPSDGPI